MANEYMVFDQHGRRLGSVVRVGQSALKKAARFFSSLDRFMSHHLEVRDVHGQVHLVLTRPVKVFKSHPGAAAGRPADRRDRSGEHDREDRLRVRGRPAW